MNMNMNRRNTCLDPGVTKKIRNYEYFLMNNRKPGMKRLICT